jgi:S-adenosyl methyltransferase
MSWEARRVPAGVDTSTPNIARMTDYFLGGKDNFAVDRKAAEELLAIAPEIKIMAEEHHAFHGRLVTHLVERGITQFINVGSGLPTRRSTHEIARSLVDGSRVAYVDRDPVVLSHARAILAKSPGTTVIEGDVMHPDALLAHPAIRNLLDLDRPLGLLIFGILQYIPDSRRPFEKVARLRDLVPVGSHVAISHVVFDIRPELAEPIVDFYSRFVKRAEDPSRMLHQVLRFFDGLEMLEPGLVYLRRWRPDNPLTVQTSQKGWTVAGVGVKTQALA